MANKPNTPPAAPQKPSKDNPSQALAPGVRHTTPECAHPLHRLLEVMAHLRGPQGCPWDKRQSHVSLIPYLIEEAYELIEAIEGGKPADVREELGDVLLQVVFHARIAEEAGQFSMADVAGRLADKMEARHPHVFQPGRELPDAEAVRDAWHQDKMRGRSSALDGIPTGQPALRWANQVGTRAARAGFDWNNTGEILAKIHEELNEFQEAWGDSDQADHPEEAEMEFGDVLFAAVQLARWRGIDPEAALRKSTRKFTRRFQAMEGILKARGLQFEKKSGAASGKTPWWVLWNEAKQATD